MKNYKAGILRATQAVIVLSITVLIITLTHSFSSFVSLTKPSFGKTVIIIDAGHGDFDPGAIAYDGTEEKDLNLSVALKLRDFFLASGYPVAMTRDDDTTLAFKGPSKSTARKRSDTQNRAALPDAYGDAVMISIHQNTFSDRSQWGTQLFYGTAYVQEGKRMAECIMGSVIRCLQPDNRRKPKEGNSNIYILTHVNAPIVLVECGFLTNRNELEQLKDEDYQRKMACCILIGYCEYERMQ